jgi:hypothetical protein
LLASTLDVSHTGAVISGVLHQRVDDQAADPSLSQIGRCRDNEDPEPVTVDDAHSDPGGLAIQVDVNKRDLRRDAIEHRGGPGWNCSRPLEIAVQIHHQSSPGVPVI